MNASERAFRLMLVYRQWADGDGLSDEEALTDVLADLRIWADEYGVDWDEAEARSSLHHCAERAS